MENDAGFVVSDPWATDSMPAKLTDSAEIYAEFFPKLHKNGSLFRYVYIPSDSKTKKFFPEAPGQPHPLMHKTATLDYIVILSGQLYLIMEDCETLLKPGDIVIQCGTNHAWSNRTEEPCIQLAILLDASDD
jgi:mannose-6-phosphate isomerase-like protein (cupin superfamily)